METSDKDLLTALSNVLSNAGSWYVSKKSEPSSSAESVESHEENVRTKSTATPQQQQMNMNIVITGQENLGTNDGIIRVLATEPVEPPPKYPRLQGHNYDPLINSSAQDALSDTESGLMVPLKELDDFRNTPSPHNTSSEDEFSDMYLNNFKTI